LVDLKLFHAIIISSMININKVRRYSVKKRFSKVKEADFAKAPVRGASVGRFFASLPNILKAKEIREIAAAVAKAKKRKKTVVFMAGAHVIKCGLNPVLIELMKKKTLSCICLNGAGIIHDFELAFQGKTSEDVAENLKDGSFGMGKETADFINTAIKKGVGEGLGLSHSVAREISKAGLKYQELSLLYNAYKLKVPVYVFVAIGTDIIHQHPSFDAGLTAEGSIRDFYSLTEAIGGLSNGGVVLNFGSAVIMPEVFLKALNLARNLGSDTKNFLSANFDMIYHYRPSQNICMRPVSSGGKGYYIIGHHEIMLPFLAQAILEEIK